MEMALIALASALGPISFFGGIALLMWIDSLNKKNQRQFEHAERLKSLEMGHPLPDAALARSRTDLSRVWVGGLVGFIVPVATSGIALAVTAIVLNHDNTALHIVLPIVVWGVVGVVNLVTVSRSLRVVSASLAELPAKEKKSSSNDRFIPNREFAGHIQA